MEPNRLFREARLASGGWNLYKSIVQMVVFWTVFLVVLPALLYFAESAVAWQQLRFASSGFRIAGVFLFLLGGSLGISSCFVMALIGRGTPLPLDCARVIVVVGPYRYIRNPMAVAGLAQGVAVGLFFGSPAIVFYALLGGPGWNFIVRPSEEKYLAERFGESYRQYRTAVSCWVPRFPGYRAVASTTESVAVSRDPDSPASEGQ